MKKLIGLFFAALFLLATSAYAKTTGEAWKEMDKNNKESIIIGFKDGFIYGFEILNGSQKAMTTNAKEYESAYNIFNNIEKTDREEIVSEMDNFYSDSSNWNIAYAYAIVYVTQKLNGVDLGTLQPSLEEARKIASEVLEKDE